MEDKYDVLNKAIYDITNTLYANTSTLLCDKITEAIYDMNKIVKDSGLKNGSKVLLI